jgi:hypothetical protein
MQYQNPFKILDISIDKVFYKNVKESNNKKIIFIKYKEELLKNMVFQLPTIKNNFILENNEIDITIDTENIDKTQKIVDFFNLIDDKIVKDAKKNSKTWFDHIDDKSKINYHHILRNKNDDSNSLKLKIIDSKDFKTNLILNNDEYDKVFLDNLPNQGNLKLVLEFYAIWINDNNFGIILRPVIISFIMNIENYYNYKILDDSESDISLDETIESNEDNLFIKASEVNLNLDEKLSNTETSDDENNLNNIIFNIKNI